MDERQTVEDMDRRRIGAARFSVGSATVLTFAKFVVGILSGSLGVLSSAFDSLADIFMSGVNFLSIRKAMHPPDTDHPYGHGKVETLATLFQAGVIGLTGGWVIWEGIRRLVAHRVPESADAGIAVMAFAIPASWFIARRIRKAGEETESSALVADSLHFATDVYTNAGILASLVLFRLTGWRWLDPGVAILLGVYILVVAGRLLLDAIQELIDRGLPEETVRRVREIIEAHRPMVVDFHELRTRRSGSEKHVDFHIVVCREYKLEDAHRLADHLEEEVRRELGKAHVVTHIDPCDIECPGRDQCERILSQIRNLEPPEGSRENQGNGRDGESTSSIGPHAGS